MVRPFFIVLGPPTLPSTSRNIHRIRANSKISWKPESSFVLFGARFLRALYGCGGGKCPMYHLFTTFTKSILWHIFYRVPTKQGNCLSQVLNLRKPEEQIKNGWSVSPETIGENLTLKLLSDLQPHQLSLFSLEFQIRHNNKIIKFCAWSLSINSNLNFRNLRRLHRPPTHW